MKMFKSFRLWQNKVLWHNVCHQIKAFETLLQRKNNKWKSVSLYLSLESNFNVGALFSTELPGQFPTAIIKWTNQRNEWQQLIASLLFLLFFFLLCSPPLAGKRLNLRMESFLFAIIAERSRKELTLVNPTYSSVRVKRKQVEVVQAQQSALFLIPSAIRKSTKSVTVNSMRFHGILLQVENIATRSSACAIRREVFCFTGKSERMKQFQTWKENIRDRGAEEKQ